MGMDMEWIMAWVWVQGVRASVPRVCMSAAVRTRPQRMGTSASSWRGWVWLCWGVPSAEAVVCARAHVRVCCRVRARARASPDRNQRSSKREAGQEEWSPHFTK